MVVTTRAKTAPPCPRPPPPDLAAHPSEEELIARFLRPRAASSSSSSSSPPRAFVHDADVYSADPSELTAGFAPAVASNNGDSAWYFFSAVRAKTRDGQRKARTVDSGDGCWHSEAGAKPVVDEAGRLLGHRQSFSFVTKVDGRRVRSGWLMVELSLDEDDEDDATDMVLCKIYFSPRARLNGGASSDARKRKAAADDKNPASSHQRRRGRPRKACTTHDDDEEKESTQGSEIANNESSGGRNEEELWSDDSTFSWWMRNRDQFMKEYNIVDRSDEELYKTLGIYESMKLLNYDYGFSLRGARQGPRVLNPSQFPAPCCVAG